MRTSAFGESRGSSTSGVLPIDSTMLPKRPPQGLLSSSSCIQVPCYFRKCSGGLLPRRTGFESACFGHVNAQLVCSARPAKRDRRESNEKDPVDRALRGPPA